MAAVQEWNQEMFEQAIANDVAIADFFAVWCGPCKMMMSVLDKAVAEFNDDEIKAGKIDIEKCRELAVRYNIRTVPTFIIFKDGKIVEQMVGVRSQKALAGAMRNALEQN